MKWSKDEVEAAILASNSERVTWPWRMALVSIPTLLHQLEAESLSERDAVELLWTLNSGIYFTWGLPTDVARSVAILDGMPFKKGPGGKAERRFVERVLAMSDIEIHLCCHWIDIETPPGTSLPSQSHQKARTIDEYMQLRQDGQNDWLSILRGSVDALKNADWDVPVDDWDPTRFGRLHTHFFSCAALYCGWPESCSVSQNQVLVPAVYRGDGDGAAIACRWLMWKFWKSAGDAYAALADPLRNVWREKHPNVSGDDPVREFLDHPSADARNRALRFLDCDCSNEILTECKKQEQGSKTGKPTHSRTKPKGTKPGPPAEPVYDFDENELTNEQLEQWERIWKSDSPAAANKALNIDMEQGERLRKRFESRERYAQKKAARKHR